MEKRATLVKRGGDGIWTVSEASASEANVITDAKPESLASSPTSPTTESSVTALEVEDKPASDVNEPMIDKAKPAGPFSCLPAFCLGACPFGLSAAAIAIFVGALGAFVLSVTLLSLPETVSCVEADERYYIKLYPDPEIISLEPPMTCVHYEARPVNVTAKSMLIYNGHIPTLLVDGDQLQYGKNNLCSEMKVRGQEVQLCRAFNFTMPQNDTFTDIHNATVFVHNYFPIGETIADPSAPCEHESVGLLVVVPPPTILAITPSVICTGASQVITVTGTHFVHALSSEAGVENPIITTQPANFQFPSTAQNLQLCQSFVVLGGKNYSFVETCQRIDAQVNAADHQQAGAGLGLDGLNTMFLVNPDPLNCAQTETREFRVVNPPVVESSDPPVICTDEREQVVTLVGRNFLRLDGQGPRVSFDNVPMTVEFGGSDEDLARDGCTEAPVQFHTVHLCTRLRVRVPQAVVTGAFLPSIVVDAPVVDGQSLIESCSATFQGLTVVPAPAIATISPDVVEDCRVRQLTITGTNFFFSDPANMTALVAGPGAALGISPAAFAKVDGFCTPLAVPGFPLAELCTRLTIDLSPGAHPSGLNTITLTNPPPLSCVTTGTIGIVPSPTVLAIAFPGVCSLNSSQILAFGGTFVVAGGVKPTFALGAPGFSNVTFSDSAVTLSGCSPLNFPSGDFQVCDNVQLDLINAADGTLQPTGNILAITNPAPAQCSFALTAQPILIVPPPTFTTVVGGANVCMDNLPQEFAVLGTFVVASDSSPPQVFVEGVLAEAIAVSSCSDLQIGVVTARQCTGLTFNVSAATPRTEGFLNVELRSSCSVPISNVFLGFVSPIIDPLRQEEDRICSVAAATVVYTGSKYADGTVGGVTAVVTLGNVAAPPIAATVTSTSVSLGVPPNTLLPGFNEVNVGNLGLDLCAATDQTLRVEPVPVIDSIQPFEYCVDQNVTLTISGSNFSPFLAYRQCITNGTACFIPPAAALDAPAALASPDFVVGDTFTVFWDANSIGRPSSGIQDIEVTNVAGCAAARTAIVNVHPQLLVFFVDPRIVFNELSLQVTVFASGLLDQVQRVTFIPTNTAVPSLVFDQNETDFLIIDGKPAFNRITLTLPSNMTVGNYSVEIESRIGCRFVSNEILQVTAQASSQISSVFPQFVFAGTGASLTVASSAPVFQTGIQAYLSPQAGTTGGAAADALSMRAVALVDSSTFGAVIPPGQTPGTYDLIVVNTDGSVQVLRSAVVVIPVVVPALVSMSPQTLASGESITLIGSNWDTALPGNRIVLSCEILVSGVLQRRDVLLANTTAVGGTTIVVSSGANNYQRNEFCVATVTRGDGASSAIGAVLFSNQATKMAPFIANAVANNVRQLTPRRAPVVVLAEPTAALRSLYVLGGDTSTSSTVVPSSIVDRLPVNLFGSPGEPIDLDPLPIPLAFSKAFTVGNYVYLVGGITRTAGVNSVSNKIFRAQVLDPLLTVPLNVDLAITAVDPTQGILETPFAFGGAYIYRVSTVFAATDNFNPGGESLPGEPLSLQLPTLRGAEVKLTMSWSAVADAFKYRLYRTPVAGGALTDVEFLVEVPANVRSFTDTGATANATDPLFGRKPIKEGSLGVFKDLSSLDGPFTAILSSGRWAHAAVAHHDAANLANFYIYAALGFTSTQTTVNFATSDTYDLCRFAIVQPTQPLEAVKHNLLANCVTTTLAAAVSRRGMVDAFSVTLQTLALPTFKFGGLGNNQQDVALGQLQSLYDPNGGILLSVGLASNGLCVNRLDLFSIANTTGLLTFNATKTVSMTDSQGHGNGFGNGVFLMTGGQTVLSSIGGSAAVLANVDEGILYKGAKGFDPEGGGASQTANADTPTADRVVYPGSLIANGRWYLVMGQRVPAVGTTTLSSNIQLSVPAA